jgi:uncharacterized protein with von Willebrand factor type A (vWA) domain
VSVVALKENSCKMLVLRDENALSPRALVEASLRVEKDRQRDSMASSSGRQDRENMIMGGAGTNPFVGPFVGRESFHVIRKLKDIFSCRKLKDIFSYRKLKDIFSL